EPRRVGIHRLALRRGVVAPVRLADVAVVPDDPDEPACFSLHPRPDHREPEPLAQRQHELAPLANEVVEPARLDRVLAELELHHCSPKVATTASATTFNVRPDTCEALRRRANASASESPSFSISKPFARSIA